MFKFPEVKIDFLISSLVYGIDNITSFTGEYFETKIYVTVEFEDGFPYEKSVLVRNYLNGSIHYHFSLSDFNPTEKNFIIRLFVYM